MAQIEGFKELSRKLSKMGEAAGGKALRSAAMSASLPALKAAMAKAPVSDRFQLEARKTYKGYVRFPGFTKRSVVRKATLSQDKRTANVRIGVKREAFYAINFIEFGTAKIKKRPWLEPAFKQSVPAMNERLRVRLKQLIDKAAKKR